MVKPFREECNKIKAKTIIEGYNYIGYDVMNVGSDDLLFGLDYLISLQKLGQMPFISSNIIQDNNNELIFPEYRIIARNDLRVAVGGITFKLPDSVPELALLDPIQTGKEIIRKLENKADVIILLICADQNQHNLIKQELIDADYVFVSDFHFMTRESMSQPESGPLFYSTGKEGRYLAQINADIVDPSVHVTDITSAKEQMKLIDKRLKQLNKKDPEKSLEELYANSENVLKVIHNYQDNLAKAQTIMANAVNGSIYKAVAMDRTIADDPQLLELVDSSLKQCEKSISAYSTKQTDRRQFTIPN